MKKLLYKNFEYPIPVVLGSYVNALGIIRSFADKNTPTICLDYKKDLAAYSRHTTFFKCPDPVAKHNEFIIFLLDLSNTMRGKGVFFATNDIWLIPISKNEEILKKQYHFPFSSWKTLKNILDKNKFYNSVKNEVDTPAFYLIKKISNIENIEANLRFPVFLKSVNLLYDPIKKYFNNKVIKVKNKDELKSCFRILKNEDLYSFPIIIQEEIKGEVSNLYTFSSYVNRDYDIKAYSIGYKIRQNPSDGGTITSGRLDNKDILYDITKKIIKKVQFFGISNIEFKFDPAERRFKVVEMNPRPGMWNYSAFSSGINLPYIAYCDYFKKKYNYAKNSSKDKVWIHLKKDAKNYFFNKNNKNFLNKLLYFIIWINRVRKEKIFAVESFKDPAPMFFEWGRVFNIIRYFINKNK